MNYLDYKRVYTLRDVLNSGNIADNRILLGDGNTHKAKLTISSSSGNPDSYISLVNSTTDYRIWVNTDYFGSLLRIGGQTTDSFAFQIRWTLFSSLASVVFKTPSPTNTIPKAAAFMRVSGQTGNILDLWDENGDTLSAFDKDGKLAIGKETPTAYLDVNGSFAAKVRTISSDYTIADDDYILAVDTTTNAITITLPSATTGRILIIKDKSGNASTNNITINTPGSETIDGSSSTTIISNYNSITLFSDGTNWFIM